MKRLVITLLALAIFVPTIALAHQPRIVESTNTLVTDPEISKAYYGQLDGIPHTYEIQADLPFDLYVGVLVPDIAGQKKDVSAVIIKDGDTENPLTVLEGANFEWEKFYEPFGADTYWKGPEYKTRADVGVYEIRVWSSNNDSKYSLAIGEIEAFDGKEGVNALTIIPKLKKNFFNENPISFIKSPFGWGLILAMFLASFIVGFLYRLIMKKFARRSTRGAPRNIGRYGRLIRATIGVALLILAITTSWSPILLFLAGFSFFEAIFSWCGFYAAIGKNTCPVE